MKDASSTSPAAPKPTIRWSEAVWASTLYGRAGWGTSVKAAETASLLMTIGTRRDQRMPRSFVS